MLSDRQIGLSFTKSSADNIVMSTVKKTPAVDSQVLADRQAAFDHALKGTPIDPETSRRIRQRAEAITEEVRRTHGLVDVIDLLSDTRG
jgi:hypothetical protein